MAKKKIAKTALALGVMTTAHPRWEEFATRLEGPEGCNFRSTPTNKNPVAGFRFNCGGAEYPLVSKILKAVGASSNDIAASIEYFAENGGQCDCEVSFNVGGDFFCLQE